MRTNQCIGDVDIVGDGITVWVHKAGFTIGRFGKLGIDIHTVDATGCLHCTHEPTTTADWKICQQEMLEFHGVTIDDVFMPRRLTSEPIELLAEFFSDMKRLAEDWRYSDEFIGNVVRHRFQVTVANSDTVYPNKAALADLSNNTSEG